MESLKLISSLERFARTIPLLVAHVPDEDAKWKPEDGAWSVLEVMTHLADEEVEDFRTRLEITLAGKGDWPPIDPEGWAVKRRYNEGDLPHVVDRWVRERDASLAWLRGLRDPDWSKTWEHPRIGPIAAGDLLASWAAHDALHVRQLTKRLFQLLDRDAGEYGSRYAGQWTA